jgi:ribosomal protein L34
VKIKSDGTSIQDASQPSIKQEPKQVIHLYLALQSHPMFQPLFTKHPTLKSQLQKVHKATMNPYDEPRSHDGGFRGRGRGRGGRNVREPERVQGQWTQDKADDLATKMLVDLMKQDAGVKEFMELLSDVSQPGGGAEVKE